MRRLLLAVCFAGVGMGGFGLGRWDRQPEVDKWRAEAVRYRAQVTLLAFQAADAKAHPLRLPAAGPSRVPIRVQPPTSSVAMMKVTVKDSRDPGAFDYAPVWEFRVPRSAVGPGRAFDTSRKGGVAILVRVNGADYHLWASKGGPK